MKKLKHKNPVRESAGEKTCQVPTADELIIQETE